MDLLQDIAQGLHGPGKFRFLIQPAIAILLGFRDGKCDFEGRRPPYFLHLLTSSHHTTILREGILGIRKPFTLAWLMDTLFQVIMLKRWNPFEALIVGLLLVALPYILSRGLTNRSLLRRRA